MNHSSQNPGNFDNILSERQILDASPVGTLITRIRDGVILFANRAIGKLLGTEDIASLIGTPVPNFYWDADERKVVLERFRAQGFLDNYEMRARRLDGSMFWVAISLQPFRFEGEQVLLSTITDVTEKKITQEQIAEGEKRLRVLFEALPQPLLVTSLADGNVLYANQQVSTLIGIPVEKIVGNRTPDFYADPADRLHFVEILQKEGRVRNAEIQIKRQDGQALWVEINIEMTSYQGIPATISIIEDISERKRSEGLLEQRIISLTGPTGETENLRFEDLFDVQEIQEIQDSFALATGVASIITDVDGKPITRPSNFCYLCEHIIRKTDKGLTNCYHSDAVLGRLNPDGPVLQPCLSGGLWDGGASIQVGGRHIANWLIGQVLDDTSDEDAMLAYGKEIGADDEEFRRALKDVTRMSKEQFAKVGQALFLIAGQLSNLAVQNLQQARHIAERKQVEAQLSESEARYQLLSEATTEGIAIHEKGIVLDVNQVCSTMFGYELAEFIGMRATDFFIPESREIVANNIRSGYEKPYEVTGLRKDGTTFPLELTGKAAPYQERMARITVLRDITERKQAEQTVRENEQRFRALFEGANDAIFTLREDILVDCNFQTPKIFKLDSKDQIIGHSVVEFSPEFQPDGVSSVQKATEKLNLARQGEAPVFEWKHIHGDGTPFDAEVSLNRLEIGGEILVQVVIRDITERKQLESQVQQAFERRGYQVQVSTDIAQDVAAAPKLDELFERVVTLTKERLGYYHTQLLRYDPAQDAVVLINGYGETGKKMLEGGHKMPMGSGLIGTAAATGETLMRSTLAEDLTWQPNPLLPDTKGEIAVPIKWQDNVLGVLDVQSDQAGALTEDDRLLLEGICGQVGIAMHSAKLVETIRLNETRLAEAADLAQLGYWELDIPTMTFTLTDQAFAVFRTTAGEQGGYQMPAADYARKFVHPDEASVVANETRLAVETDDPHYAKQLEHRMIRADGSEGMIVVNFRILKNEQGQTIKTFGIFMDITERKQEHERIERLVEERTVQLNESQRLLQTVLDNFPGIVYWKSKDLTYLGCNRMSAIISGLSSPAEIIGKTDYDMPWGSTQADAYRADDLVVMESGQPRLHIVEPQKQADGTTTWLDTSKVPLLDAKGEIIGILGISSDVSDRMRAEEAVRASREQLSNIIDFLPDATFVIDKDRKVIAWNRAIEEMTGIAKDDIIGKGDYAYAVPFYGDARPILVDFALDPGDNVPGRYDTVGWRENTLVGEVYVPGVYKGRGAHLYATASPLYDADGNIIGAVEAIRDITERKEMEVVMQENEARFRALFEKSADAILLLENGVFTDCNQATVEMMHATDKTQFLSLSPSSLSPEYQPDGRLSSEKADEMIQTALVRGVHRFEWIHRRTDGSEFPAEVLLTPIALGERQVIYSVWRDITERKQADAQLQQEKAFSDTVINSLPGVFYMLGPNGEYIRWNENIEKVLGYSGEELARMNALDNFVEDERALVLSRIQEVFVKGISSVEANYLTKDGDKIPYFFTGRQVLIGDVPYLIGVGIDVTERKYLEAQLQQTLQRRGYQVQLSTEISQEIASASDLGVLFEQVVTLIKERLEYYHAQLLRYDPMQDAMLLVAGYGEIGAKMLALNHRMPMGRGLIGLAAADGETVLRSTLADDPNWQPNPLLPETRGEIAVPIKLGDQILGVLDVQSDQAGALTDDDRLLLEGLCGQIAVAMEQTRLRAEMAERLDEINILYRTMSREGWDTFRQTADLPPGFQFDQTGVRPLEGAMPLDSNLFSAASLAVPGGASVGSLALLDDPNRPLTREDQAFLQQVSEQVALALESARLFAQTQYTLGETETLYATSAQLNTASTYGEILEVLRQNTLLGQDSQNVSMNVFDRPWTLSDMPEWIDVLARWSALPAGAVSDRYPLSAFPSAKDLLHADAPTIIENVLDDPRLDVNARALYADRYGAKSTIFVPLVVAGQWMGYLNAIYQTPTRFPENDVRRLVALGAQAAVVINNQRLFEETQSRANRERILREVTTRVRASVDADTILRTAVRELGEALKRETFVQMGGSHSVPSADAPDGG